MLFALGTHNDSETPWQGASNEHEKYHYFLVERECHVQSYGLLLPLDGTHLSYPNNLSIGTDWPEQTV